jgi:hypothetical protein
MASLPVVLTGAQIELWINNKQYKEVESLTFNVSYGEEAIYGIDSPYPQEIAVTRIEVAGSVSGLRLKLSGGLQAKNMRSLFMDVMSSPYISIRVTDRVTQEDILFIPQAKITREAHTVPSRGTYKLNFDFRGLVPYFALDRS